MGVGRGVVHGPMTRCQCVVEPELVEGCVEVAGVGDFCSPRLADLWRNSRSSGYISQRAGLIW